MTISSRQFAGAYLDLAEKHPDFDGTSLATSFVAFLNEQGMRDQWRAILREIPAAWKEKYGVGSVAIRTAHPLSQEARQEIEKQIGGATVNVTLDPSLIGGAVIQIDDRLIDGSIAGKLNQLHKHLLTSESF